MSCFRDLNREAPSHSSVPTEVLKTTEGGHYKRIMKNLQYYQFVFCYLLVTIKEHAHCVKEISITPGKPHVKLGDTVTLTCETTCQGSPRWKELDDSDAEISGTGNKSFLKISGVQLYHQGTYTCIATRCLTKKKESVKLRVDSVEISTTNMLPEVLSTSLLPTITKDPQVANTLKTTVKADLPSVHTTEYLTERFPTTTRPTTINSLKANTLKTTVKDDLPSVHTTEYLTERFPTTTQPATINSLEANTLKTTVKADLPSVHTTEYLTERFPTTTRPTTINSPKASLSTEVDVEVNSITTKLPEVLSASLLPTKTSDPQVKNHPTTTINADIFPLHVTENPATTLLPTTTYPPKDMSLAAEAGSSSTTMIMAVGSTVCSVAILSFLGFLVHLIRRKKRKLSPNDPQNHLDNC